jgi:plastocyanin
MNRAQVTRRSLVVSLVAALLLTACGGGTATPVEVPVTVDLEVRAKPGLRWDATSYTAAAGEIEVALVNDDSMRHTLVVIEDETIISGFELEVNRKGDIDTGTITLEPGSYTIFCTVPGHQNMRSELIVE